MACSTSAQDTVKITIVLLILSMYSGMLSEIQGGFRRGRRTEDNLFMLERLIEMVKGRKVDIFVVFLDMEKAYDRVNRKKLFEVMRCYGVHEKLVRLIERIYNGSMVKFELEKVPDRMV